MAILVLSRLWLDRLRVINLLAEQRWACENLPMVWGCCVPISLLIYIWCTFLGQDLECCSHMSVPWEPRGLTGLTPPHWGLGHHSTALGVRHVDIGKIIQKFIGAYLNNITLFWHTFLSKSGLIFLKNRNMNILISNLLSKSIFHFRKWSIWKLRKYAYLYNFQFDHFPKLTIDSESRFEMKMPIFLF